MRHRGPTVTVWVVWTEQIHTPSSHQNILGEHLMLRILEVTLPEDQWDLAGLWVEIVDKKSNRLSLNPNFHVHTLEKILDKVHHEQVLASERGAVDFVASLFDALIALHGVLAGDFLDLVRHFANVFAKLLPHIPILTTRFEETF